MLWSMRRCSGGAISFLRIARNTEKLCIQFLRFVAMLMSMLSVN